MEHFPLVDRLHTDVLEEKYGAISVKLVRHTRRLREAHLVDRSGISRTYSLTFFPAKRERRIASVEKDIASGAPIGKAFRMHGYAIRKNVVEVFLLPLPGWLRKAFRTKEMRAKARISEFYAKKRGEEPVIYGDVLEVYSPDFRPQIINAVDLSQDNPLTRVLQKKGFSKEEVWRRIGNDNDWSDVEKKYFEAKRASRPLELKLKKTIERYISRKRLK